MRVITFAAASLLWLLFPTLAQSKEESRKASTISRQDTVSYVLQTIARTIELLQQQLRIATQNLQRYAHEFEQQSEQFERLSQESEEISQNLKQILDREKVQSLVNPSVSLLSQLARPDAFETPRIDPNRLQIKYQRSIDQLRKSIETLKLSVDEKEQQAGSDDGMQKAPRSGSKIDRATADNIGRMMRLRIEQGIRSFDQLQELSNQLRNIVDALKPQLLQLQQDLNKLESKQK